MNKKKWHNIINKFKKLNVLIVGDAMIDAYLWGHVDRQSPEALVPVVNVKCHEKRLGGAANVAKNIKKLGANPILCSVIGNNDQGFLELMKLKGLNTSGIIQEERKTTVKTRIISKEKHQLRIDEEDVFPIRSEEIFIDKIISLMKDTSIIMLQDYNKGVLTPKIIKKLISTAKSMDIPIAVDPKKENFWNYKNVDLFKPNLKELNDACKLNLNGTERSDLFHAAKALQKKLNAKSVLLTLSENGMYYLKEEGIYQAALDRKIIDVSGAGDSVFAAASLALAANLSNSNLITLSNTTGGLVCEKIGVAAIDKELLIKTLKD